ncbi:MAG: sulfite exporter TauE/SafE family protein [Chloroflexota bacterium]
MVDLLIAFVTGLTTGGLSCLAVQGGLLASSLAGQIEKDLQNSSAAPHKRSRKNPSPLSKPQLAKPILMFLLAKLVAYTILGLFLGWAGQVLQLSPYTRAFLLIAIGIFMLGSALRMLNVHPIFRYFAFEPPAALRRWLRRKAGKTADSPLWTPALLGALTVLIPCGVTQVMMAAALATGDPLQSAALMFAFTLGTSPLFFVVAYFTTQIGARLERYFMRFVAIVVLILAIVTIDSGIALAGSPVSLTRWFNQQLIGNVQPGLVEYQPLQAEDSSAQVITIRVQNYGYEPALIRAEAGVPTRLRLISKDVYSCSLAFTVPSLGIQELLQPTGITEIEIPPQQQGSRLTFSCSMGMYGGVILFEDV